MSYFGIGIRQPKHDENVGTLMRAALSFGASYVFTVGRKYYRQATDTTHATKQIPYIHFKSDDDFLEHIPQNCRIVCVENTQQAHSIKNFVHPRNAIYLLGSEVSGLPKRFTDKFYTIILPGQYCHNVSLAGGMVMFDRVQKE